MSQLMANNIKSSVPLQFTPEPALLPARQQLASSVEVLTEIFSADVNLAVWQRSLAPAVASYSQQLLSLLRLPLQHFISPEQLPDYLQQALPDAPGKDEFIADLALIAQMFACLMECQQLGLRLKVLNQAMCPRFYTDHLCCRLVTTYHGPATEWHAGPVTDNNARVQQLQQADVALLKGSGWENMATYAISHRSPALAEPRLLLTLDPVWQD